MIYLDPQKKAILEAATQLCMVDLITIKTKTGVTMRHTSGDQDLYIEGEYYDSSLRWERDKISLKAGLEVSTISLTIYPTEDDVVGGMLLSQAVRAGVLDGAQFTLERAFFIPDWSSYQFKILRFVGKFADVTEFTRTEIPITVNSFTEILNVNMPREVYQPGCRRVLYGAGCGVDPADFMTACTVMGGATTQSINAILGGPERTFTLGTVTFTSGVNEGLTRTIKAYSSGTFEVIEPLPAAPEPGDTFTAFAGCDRTMSTCSNVFGNLDNFAGEPFIPVAETAY